MEGMNLLSVLGYYKPNPASFAIPIYPQKDLKANGPGAKHHFRLLHAFIR